MKLLPPAALFLACAFFVPACQSPALSVHVMGHAPAESESHRLRAEDAKLRAEMDAVKARLAASETEAAALRRRADGAPLEPGVVPPMAVTLEFDDLTGPVNTAPNASIHAEAKGLFNILRIYAVAYDQEHRLIPVAGRALVQVVVPAAGGKPERVLASQHWDMKAFAAAWRDNLTGTCYALEMPLPKELPAAWTLRAVVEDLATGNRLHAEENFPR